MPHCASPPDVSMIELLLRVKVVKGNLGERVNCASLIITVEYGVFWG